MFNNAKRTEKQQLSMATGQILTEMLTYGPDSPEYPDMLDRLERVTKVRKTTSPMKGVSPDTVAIVAGNLLGILTIVAYEQKHVMVSTAQKFLLKAH